VLAFIAAPAAADQADKTAARAGDERGAACLKLASLRNGDSQLFARPSYTKAACHPITSCQPNYPSCASWSGYTDCDDPFCGIGIHCGDDCGEFGPCPGDALKQRRERFRVCFNAQGQSCTEWSRTMITLGCGCE
jgi:hypothetical protein